MIKYYLDTCIWLNLFKKEGNSSKGIPYWKIAKDFIEKVENSEDLIIVSPLILKELKFKLDTKYSLVKDYFNKNEKICIVKSQSDDFTKGRKLESESNYEISFFDCLHISICKRLNLILVTRDRDLIKFSNNHIISKKPEELY